ncbi:MAG: glutathione-dependent formaldehyde dehydrogenase, partial [Methanobacteriota archaeon]
MKALCWFGANDVRVEQVPDPHVINPHDAVIRISSTSICGSDLHLYHGYVPAMKKGDILGHEFMGEIVETGKAVSRLKSGDRVVVPFAISCGKCFYCADGMFSLCDNTNPNYRMAEKKYGYSGAGLFGYSHLFGGYAGGQAEFARVPFADVGCVKIPDGVADERVLFLSDVLPTGYMAAENCDIHPGDIVAVWGCGPVGQMAIKCAYLLGAERVIAIDHMPARLALAQTRGGADVLNYEEVDILDELKARTGGRGPDACIDAVGMEAHGKTLDAIYDYAKQALRLETDRLHALRAAIQACRKGGTLSVSGVYGGILDKVPLGAAFAKGLKIRMGQTHVQRYMQPLMDRILNDGIDASYLITHQLRLDDAPIGYKIFDD